jgi:hypothetical protein
MLRASELVDKLQDLIREHGDLEVVNDQDEEVDVEFNQDSADPVFVIA